MLPGLPQSFCLYSSRLGNFMADRQTIDSAYVRIQESLRRGEWEPAASECRELLQLAPGEAPAWYFLGVTALQRGGIAEAEAALQRAVVLAPQQAAYRNL